MLENIWLDTSVFQISEKNVCMIINSQYQVHKIIIIILTKRH